MDKENLTDNKKRVVREYFVELSPTITTLLEIELITEEELLNYRIITKNS